jgi:hypothetical protein
LVTDSTALGIVVRYEQGNLFGRTQTREEAEFIIIADGFTPIGMQLRDQCLGLLNREGGDDGAVFLGHSETREARGRVVLFRVIPVPVIESAANHTDGVVVGLFRPLKVVYDPGEFGVSDLIENSRPNLGSPDLREELGVPPGGHVGQVPFCDPRIAGD